MLGAARVSARREVFMAESDTRETIIVDSDEQMPDGGESESSEDWFEDEEDDEDGDDAEFRFYAGVVPARDVGTRRDIHPESQDRKTFVGLSRMPGVTPEGNGIGMTGEGLFARRAFKCGEVVIEFVAPRIVREPRFDKMVLAEGLPRDVGIKMDKSYMVDDDLLRRLRQKQHQGLNSWYKMNCGEESFNNVSLSRGERAAASGICQTLVFKAMRDIKQDEELTWKYDGRSPGPVQRAELTPATKNMTPAAQACAEAVPCARDEELEDAAQAPRARDGVPEASCERKRRKTSPSTSGGEPEEEPQTEGTRDRAAAEAAADAAAEAAAALSTQDDAPHEEEAQEINAFNARSGHAAAAHCSMQLQDAVVVDLVRMVGSGAQSAQGGRSDVGIQEPCPSPTKPYPTLPDPCRSRAYHGAASGVRKGSESGKGAGGAEEGGEAEGGMAGAACGCALRFGGHCDGNGCGGRWSCVGDVKARLQEEVECELHDPGGRAAGVGGKLGDSVKVKMAGKCYRFRASSWQVCVCVCTPVCGRLICSVLCCTYACA